MGHVRAAAIMSVLLLAACGSSDTASIDTAADIGAPSATDQILSENEQPDTQASTDVVGTSLDGNSFSLQATLASKPVVLWFWAPG